MSRPESGRAHSHTLRARAMAKVCRSSERFWKFSDLPGSASTAQHVLADLADQGELRRVRKGLYWRGLNTPLGMSVPSAEQLTAELAGTRGVGPAGLSASNMLRLSTQVPRYSVVAVPGRPPESAGALKFVSRAARKARATARLQARDIAVLETLEDWEHVVEVPWEDAWNQLTTLLERDSDLAERLARASVTEPAVVRVRLSALLSNAGRDVLARMVPHVDPRTRQLALESLAVA